MGQLRPIVPTRKLRWRWADVQAPARRPARVEAGRRAIRWCWSKPGGIWRPCLCRNMTARQPDQGGAAPSVDQRLDHVLRFDR
jgi:hypothetical protein